MARWVVVAAALTALSAQAAAPTYFTGHQLAILIASHDRVTSSHAGFSDTDFANAAKLQGFVTAVVELEAGANFCPKGATVLDAILVVRQYMLARTPELDRPAVQLAEEALIKAWPCRK